jgi:aspartate aminotransferase
VFGGLQPLPADAILGIMTLFRADKDPRKVDLSVGVYQDETGNTPVFDCVRRAERKLLEEEKTKTYVAIAGNAGFNECMEQLLFGASSSVVVDGRVATVQTPGGSGALSVAGHLIYRAQPGTRVFLSEPSWPNHLPLIKLSGLRIEQYPYYDFDTHRIDFDAMVGAVERMRAGDVLLLHGCCHNPSGADLSPRQWKVVAELCARLGIVPFIDFAYQGLAEGVEADAHCVRVMSESVPEFIVVSSCSKNFGLYRERVGACCIVSENRNQRDAVFSNLANVARSIYSMPPDHGAAIVAKVLHDASLKEAWVSELDGMRDRLKGLRRLLVEKLGERTQKRDFSFITTQSGLFSFLGLSKKQIVRLREEFHVYMVESSRVNIAGVNETNVDMIADAIAAVV